MEARSVGVATGLPAGPIRARLHSTAWNGRLRKSLLKRKQCQLGCGAGRAFLCPLLLDGGGAPSRGRHGLLHVAMLHVTMPYCEARSEGAAAHQPPAGAEATAGTPA